MDIEDQDMNENNNIYPDQDYIDQVQKESHVYESYLWASYTHLRLAYAAVNEHFKEIQTTSDIFPRFENLINDIGLAAANTSAEHSPEPVNMTDRKFDSEYFGDVTLKYKMKDLDGRNLEEIVVVYDEKNRKLGEIFGVAIEDVTDIHIHDTCDYNQKFD